MGTSERRIAWVRAAEKDFLKFPPKVQSRMRDALLIAAEGVLPDIAKPMKHLEAGVQEIALAYRRGAYRAVYTVRYGDALWVVHAFEKKATKGIATPKKEIDLIKARLKRIKEMYR